MPGQQNLQIAVDTGGTFTDIGVRKNDGSISVWKVPSTPSAPDEAVIRGITEAVSNENASPRDISRLVHGTTVATNTVLTRTGARVALITTRGFKDILAIAGQDRPNLYDLNEVRVAPLVDSHDIYELSERLDADGEVVTPLDPDELAQLGQKVKDENFDVIVVSFLNAYSNPQHEAAVVEALEQAQAAPLIFAATSISPEMREYDRTSTAVINGYVGPKVSSYIKRLEQSIADLDIPVEMKVMQSNGGLLSPSVAANESAKTVLSGLAGGVVGAAKWASTLELKDVVSFDIGGTSTDIALIRNGSPDETTLSTIGSLPLRLPSVDVHTIGAGGGSIAWLDSGDSLRVGPQSAGAVPGPISYQRGGTEITVTDAHVVLGRLSGSLLGGNFDLDYDSAYSRMEELATKLGLSTEECAEGIIKVITTTMGRGVRKVSIERGVDIRACDLMAFGGAGPLHGSDLAHELKMKSVVIPPLPGIASAVGMLDAEIRLDFSAPIDVKDSEAFSDLDSVYATLKKRAQEAFGEDSFEEEHLLDCRYAGQSYELTVTRNEDWDSQRAEFDQHHDVRYGYSDDDATMEITTARLIATIPQQAFDLEKVSTNDKQVTPIDHRKVYVEGAWLETPIYERDDIPAGWKTEGPAIINQFDTTTYIRPHQQCRCDEYGFLHLTESATNE